MKPEIEKVKTVEELNHFPFKNLIELKKAIVEGIAYIGVDRGVALQWAQKGIYAPSSLRVQALIYALLPFVAVLGVILYAIMSGTWVLLLSLPLLIIAYFIFHPSSAAVFGIIRSGFITLTFLSLVYSYFSDVEWLLVLSGALVLMWYSLKNVYQKSVDKIVIAALEHEDLLCLLWQGKVLGVDFFNGDRFWVDCKIQNGVRSIYED